MKRNTIFLALVAISTAFSVGTANAGTSNKNDGLAISNAKVGLVQAIKTAEQHVAGNATHADLEHEHGKWVYEVEVVALQSIMDVTIDSVDGKVISVREDKNDHDSSEHED